MAEHINILKKLCKTAKQHDDESNSWDDEDLERLIVLYFVSFQISETSILKFIQDMKLFRTSLLAILIEKNLVQVSTTWKAIINYARDGAAFLAILDSAVNDNIPILTNKFKSVDVLEQVSFIFAILMMYYSIYYADNCSI
jgi:hypothetical protein